MKRIIIAAAVALASFAVQASCLIRGCKWAWWDWL